MERSLARTVGNVPTFVAIVCTVASFIIYIALGLTAARCTYMTLCDQLCAAIVAA